MKRIVFIPLSLIVSIIFLTGCFNFGDGFKIPLGDGESVTIGGGDDDEIINISFEGEEGSVNLSSDGESFKYEGEDGKVTVHRDLPEDFPADVPIPEDIDPVGNFITEFEDDTLTGYTLSYAIAEDRFDEVRSLYENYLADNNYSITNKSEASGDAGNGFEVEAEKGNRKFSILMYGDTNGQFIMLHVAEEK
ncbi:MULTISPECIES: hypothetical protein [Bacillaceae]|uniref:Lipoprotein n=1 Tax=Evansella alkalicola TaxID=745819 RepID=A0ABS6JNG0_9BACI|nr:MULTISPECIES: hypothetical protein [Bacillaceae]MBU9720099.1 hypothetical protein [Bacillus alkalicola]